MNTQQALHRAKTELFEHDYTMVAIDAEGRSYVSRERGVAPVMGLVRDGVDLTGGVAADRVVGKAAAMLFVLLGAHEVYAHVLSGAAMRYFIEEKMVHVYDRLVPYIVNREGTGRCPLEAATHDLVLPCRAPAVIERTLARLKDQEHE